MTYRGRFAAAPRFSSSSFTSASAALISSFTACAPCEPPVTNTTNASAGMKSNRRPFAIPSRTGSPVRTVFTPGRYSAVMSKLIATVFA